MMEISKEIPGDCIRPLCLLQERKMMMIYFLWYVSLNLNTNINIVQQIMIFTQQVSFHNFLPDEGSVHELKHVAQ